MGDRYFINCPGCPQETSPPADWPEDQPWYPDTELYFAEHTDWKSRCGRCNRVFRLSISAVPVEEQGHE